MIYELDTAWLISAFIIISSSIIAMVIITIHMSFKRLTRKIRFYPPLNPDPKSEV